MEREARIRRHAASLLGPEGKGVLPSPAPQPAPVMRKQSQAAHKPSACPGPGEPREASKGPRNKVRAGVSAGVFAENVLTPAPRAPSAKPKGRKGGDASQQQAPRVSSTPAEPSLGKRANGDSEDRGHERVPGGNHSAEKEEGRKGKKQRKRRQQEPQAQRGQGTKGSGAPDTNGGAAHERGFSAGARLMHEGRQQGAQVAGRSSSVLGRMRAHLAGGRFRMLNEALYTRSGDEALRLFGAEPGAFASYHSGFREQVARWPQNPLDCVIQWLGQNDPEGELVVADFGCGEAQLAASVKQKVFSLDLVAWTPQVTACNMAHTPLESLSVDVGVFCLSLMGTDYPSFILEADRTLRPRGRIIVAEVRSRFEDKADAVDSLFGAFEQCMKRLGYKLTETVHSNKMFLVCVFQKRKSPAGPPRDLQWPVLKPCIYKRR